jgi:hypothetical protein
MTSARTIGFAVLPFACTCGIFVACGGGVAGGGSPAADGGPLDGATSADSGIPAHDAMPVLADADAATGDGAPRVPANHRPVDILCPKQRGPGDTGGLSPGDCDADTDCTSGANGRCLASCGPPGCFASNCSYDGCFTDSDCGGTVPCACRPSVTSNLPNYCLVGSTCAIDSDCGPGGYCSASGRGEWCTAKYHCHTALDVCLDDSDCADGGGSGRCNFQPTLGYWACGPVCGPPPP